jgi:hypothetical protein
MGRAPAKRITEGHLVEIFASSQTYIEKVCCFSKVLMGFAGAIPIYAQGTN